MAWRPMRRTFARAATRDPSTPTRSTRRSWLSCTRCWARRQSQVSGLSARHPRLAESPLSSPARRGRARSWLAPALVVALVRPAREPHVDLRTHPEHRPLVEALLPQLTLRPAEEVMVDGAERAARSLQGLLDGRQLQAAEGRHDALGDHRARGPGGRGERYRQHGLLGVFG